uniref:Uncharacterized protein n=1 Tax=Romanomermis culicivorax TaxID=13658 RepID=A0A915LAH4_ROMCU
MGRREGRKWKKAQIKDENVKTYINENLGNYPSNWMIEVEVGENQLNPFLTDTHEMIFAANVGIVLPRTVLLKAVLKTNYQVEMGRNGKESMLDIACDYYKS